MRSDPGPGGTLVVELDGMGVTWMLRPSAEGVRIVQHGGAHGGEHSGFIMVPERGSALTALTNSDGGPQLLRELFYDDWGSQALRRGQQPPGRASCAVPRPSWLRMRAATPPGSSKRKRRGDGDRGWSELEGMTKDG